MQTELQSVFSTDFTAPDNLSNSDSKQTEPTIGVDRYARSIVCSVAIMIGAYITWAQDFGNTGFAIFLLVSTSIVAWNLSVDTNKTNAVVFQFRLLLLGIGLLLGCLRIIWQPNAIACLAAVLLCLAIAMAMQTTQLSIWHLITFPLNSVANGVIRWTYLPWERLFNGMSNNRLAWLTWCAPLFAGLVFLVPLIQSHPEMASNLFHSLSEILNTFLDYASQINTVSAILVALTGIWSLGLLLPRFQVTNAFSKPSSQSKTDAACSSITYFAARNTLVVVSGVFVWFLMIEFQATWFREFPEGFIYPTYAHQGAAWLTVALAMSTAAMSILFRPEMHQHPRIATLRRLAWFWSLCNVLLVIAVFYRLLIYVNFNGLTRMRIIGFVGVACVFVGFIISHSRIMGQKSITSILHKQFWTPTWSVYLLALLPMDTLSHAWNCSRIHTGHLSPAVQLAVQSISDEGLICILPLIESEVEEIRDGVSALLAERIARSTLHPDESQSNHAKPTIRWTQFQGSRFLLEHRLQKVSVHLQPFVDSPNLRKTALIRFQNWTKRWY